MMLNTEGMQPMGHTITIPDDIYDRLDVEARAKGLSIEQLLRSWPTGGIASHGANRDVLARVAALGDELSARYGEMPDSTDLVREDRAR
jgi:hypothetical protein